jgi:acylpyruvate hydrolase
MRLATMATPRGLRLHVRGRTGYLDVADGTGDPALATLRGLLEAGALDAARALANRDGAEFSEADFGPAVPEPRRILCLGVNYREHAIEGGRAIPTWPEAFVRGEGSAIGPYADLVKPALTSRFDFEGELGLVIGTGGRYIPAGKALDAIAGYVALAADERLRPGTGSALRPNGPAARTSRAPCRSARNSSRQTRLTYPTPL